MRRYVVFGLAIFLLLICALVILIGVEVSSIRRQTNANSSQAEQHLADHRPQLGEAVADVLSKHAPGTFVDVQSLPIPLQVPDMRRALVGKGYVTLVISSNPDTDRGFRVWNGEQAAD